MKIEKIRIENFRSFRDETIYFDNFTCFVGPNGSGKSTIINALNVFFRQQKDIKTDFSKLSKDDFHHKNTDIPIKITITFTDLSDKAKKDLANYVRQDKLTVSSVAKYDTNTEYAEVKQYGNRLGFDEFRKYFEAEKNNAKVSELKDIYNNLKQTYNDLQNVSTKQAMGKALIDLEASSPDKCSLIQSEDQFYGVSRGINRLEPHIQWVYVSASKDVTEEGEESKTSALGQLLARTVRSKVNFTEKIGGLKEKTQKEYQSILEEEQEALNDISASLKDRLEMWSHPGISAEVLWKQDPERSVKVEEPWAFLKIGERGFEGDLARFGHGLQRSYLLALLQEMTSISDEFEPTLVLGIEEPEIYQHPPQAKYLSETLYDLSKKNSQVVICSHSPLFIPGDNFETVRIVKEKDDPSTSFVAQLKYEDLSQLLSDTKQGPLREEGIMAKLYPSLNPIISEMFFCKFLILTEGIEDAAYLTTYIMLDGKMGDFRKNGCHIVPVGGKRKIIKPLAIARLLNIPVFVVFDADTNKTNETEVGQHKIENKKIQDLLGLKDINEWPDENIFTQNCAVWKTNLSSELKESLNGKWDDFKTKAEEHYGNPGGLNKNPLAIAYALELAWKENVKPVLLQKVTENIIAYAESVSNQ